MNFLKGKKTYIVAIVWGATVVAQQLGFLQPFQIEAIQSILVPLGLVTLRKGVSDSK